MKQLGSLCMSLTLLAILAVSARREDKEVTLKGKITCAKCMLKLKGMHDRIQVKEGDKNVVYLFLDKGNRESYHEEVCGGGEKEGSVTGTVFEKDGKKWIKPKEVKYVK